MLSAGNAAVNVIPKHKLCIDNKKTEVTFTGEKNMNLFALLVVEPIGSLIKGLILEYFFLGKKKSIKLHNLLAPNKFHQNMK